MGGYGQGKDIGLYGEAIAIIGVNGVPGVADGSIGFAGGSFIARTFAKSAKVCVIVLKPFMISLCAVLVSTVGGGGSG